MLKLQVDLLLLARTQGNVHDHRNKGIRLPPHLVFATVNIAQNKISLGVADRFTNHGSGGINEFQMGSCHGNTLGIENLA